LHSDFLRNGLHRDRFLDRLWEGIDLESELAGVAMAERRFPTIVDLRGDLSEEVFAAAAKGALGFALPAEPNSAAGDGALSALWLGPDEWWVVGRDRPTLAEDLAKAFEGKAAAVTEVGESRTCIRLSGPHARDLIAKGCPLDLHPKVFATGHCTQGMLAKAGILLHQVSDEPAYDVYVLRSFAEYLWLWLEDAAQEYGVTVVAG
jgi:sarcosine oxidase subunit gamma